MQIIRAAHLVNVAPECTLTAVGWSGSVTGEVLATGDGATTSFSGTVAKPPVTDPTSFTVHYTIGSTAYSATAGSDGTISGEHITSGSIDTWTGDWSLTFDTTPDNGTDLTADYDEGVAPGNFHLAVDGDPSTETSTGSRTMDAAGIAGYVDVEFPVAGVYLVGLLCSVWNPAGQACRVDAWLAGNEDVLLGVVPSDAVGTDTVRSGFLFLTDGTKVRLGFRAEAACRLYCKLKELVVYRLS